MTPISITVTGADGRMGKMILEAAAAASDITVAAALVPSESASLGQPVPGTKLTYTDDAEKAFSVSDVVIDFTRPAGTMAYLALCRKLKKPIVIGTTGFSPEEKAAIGAAGEEIAVVFAPNMSKGVNAVFKLVAEAARVLADYDCEIVEMHHAKKVDVPSGTALEMGRVAAKARGVKFEDVAVLSREGHTGERKTGSIGFAALRGGDVVGDHTVIFAGPGERIEITHRSGSRAGYAAGALEAARFVTEKRTGLFSMADVLGITL